MNATGVKRFTIHGMAHAGLSMDKEAKKQMVCLPRFPDRR